MLGRIDQGNLDDMYLLTLWWIIAVLLALSVLWSDKLLEVAKLMLGGVSGATGMYIKGKNQNSSGG